MAAEERLNELQSVLDETKSASSSIADSFEIKKNEEKGGDQPETTIHIDPAQWAEYQRLSEQTEQLKSLIADEKERIGHPDAVSRKNAPVIESAALAASAGTGAPVQQKRGDVGSAFVQSEEFKAFQASGLYTMPEEFKVNASLTEYKDSYHGMVTPTTPIGFSSPDRIDMVGTPQRPVRVRDLFPARATTSNLIDYFRTTGFEAANNASVTPDYSAGWVAKPQTGMTFEARSAPVRTIAHWEAAHRNVIADEPQLQALINNELLYGLRLHEDYQILQGTGTSEDLTGLLVDADVQTYSGSSGPATDTDIDAIRRAMTLVMLANYETTGIVVHPTDWEGMELVKDTQDRYIATVSVAVGAVQNLFRIPVVATPAIPENTALVGAFGLGAQLFDREMSNIRISEHHDTFFASNAVAILAEQRLALAITRPESFVNVTLD
jgi:HK97 family phage major capsid protein